VVESKALFFLEQIAFSQTNEYPNVGASSALLLCGSWLACDPDTSVHQAELVDAIAGKPAPTKASSFTESLLI